MDRLLRLVLQKLIRTGNLRITTARGSTFTAGDKTGTPVAIRFTTRAAQRGVLIDPELRLGEAYMDGGVILERGSIADLLAVVLGQPTLPRWARPQRLFRYIHRRAMQFNSRRRARSNVVRHYDLDSRLYALFLDADLQYSCAFFESAGQSLDDAQLAKKRHLAAKLLTAPGQRVLDIGCGWGGLALYLSEHCDTRVTGITLSEKQLAIARGRAAETGAASKAQFRLQDYRDLSGTFDRIVSVGMFEHVGPGFYDAFFRKCATLLDDDGVMLLSSIGRSEGPSATNPWIAKYIFPGGYIPALSEVLPSVERAGLLVTDIEILRLHYAETLKAWREYFAAYRDAIECVYDPRFARMWEFYLAASEMAFRKQAMMVFQLQLARKQGAVPTTRDYIARETARLRTLDGTQRLPSKIACEQTSAALPRQRAPGNGPQSEHAVRFNHYPITAGENSPRRQTPIGGAKREARPVHREHRLSMLAPPALYRRDSDHRETKPC